MANVTFAITENIAVIGNGTKGWQKEVNMVSWNGGEAKLDIRDWAPDHSKMGKGIVLTEDEARKLADSLTAYFGGLPAVEPTPVQVQTPVQAPEPAPEPVTTADPLGLTAEQLELIAKAKAILNGGN